VSRAAEIEARRDRAEVGMLDGLLAQEREADGRLEKTVIVLTDDIEISGMPNSQIDVLAKYEGTHSMNNLYPISDGRKSNFRIIDYNDPAILSVSADGTHAGDEIREIF
jgi:hypothetical protein